MSNDMRKLMKITESYAGIGDEDRDYHEEEIQRFYDMGKRDLWILFNNTVEENNPEDHDALQYMENALERYGIGIAEGMDDDPNRPGWKDEAGNWNKYEDCPTCHGWGEYIPPGVEQDIDNVVPCPDCADDLGPAAQGKSKIVKQMGDEADAGWTVKDFPLSESDGEPDECPNCSSVALVDGECGVCEYWKDELEEQGPGDDAEWDAHWAREDGDDERADDLEADAEWARMDDELDEQLYNKCSDDEMNDAILRNTCGVCGEKFEWEGNPDDKMCPRCTGEYIGENQADECERCFGLGRHPSGGKDCSECGGTGKCPALEEDYYDKDQEYFNVLIKYKDQVYWDQMNSEALPRDVALDWADDHKEGQTKAQRKGRDVYIKCYNNNKVFKYIWVQLADPEEYLDEDEGDDLGIGMQPADLKRVGQTYVVWRSDYPVEYKHKIDPAYAHNERTTNHDSRKEALAQIKAEIQAYIATHDDPSVTHKRGSTVWQGRTPYDPAYERGAFDQKWRLKEVPVEKWVESVNLDSIVESVLEEFPGQPRDYEMSDDELEADVLDTTKEFEKDQIDPNIEDEELGLRFD